MKTYKHIFFDLDHTLWDFETNSRLTLEELFEEHQLHEKGIDLFERFHKTYIAINSQYWARYHKGEISKEKLRNGRFQDTLRYFGIYDKPLAVTMANEYTERSPFKTHLYGNAIETLDYLHKKYPLHLITNGFSEVQYVKIKNSGIHHFFQHIFVSDEVGFQKPAPEIFRHALDKAGCLACQGLMIGDNMQTDILGAKAIDMDQVYFNPRRQRVFDQPTYMISDLAELRNLL
ncbi:MAG: YjjG family noncanonical pyrimidine nucleotidase [Chitinophagales bacterium]